MIQLPKNLMFFGKYKATPCIVLISGLAFLNACGAKGGNSESSQANAEKIDSDNEIYLDLTEEELREKEVEFRQNLREKLSDEAKSLFDQAYTKLDSIRDSLKSFFPKKEEIKAVYKESKTKPKEEVKSYKPK